MNLRKINGKPVFEGEQIEIDNGDKVEYLPVTMNDHLYQRKLVGEYDFGTANSFTFKDFIDATFPVRGRGIDVDIILDKNYKGEGEVFDIQALINKLKNLRNYDDINVKFKFYPTVDKNGEKTTPFKIYNYQEDVIKKANLLEPIK